MDLSSFFFGHSGSFFAIPACRLVKKVTFPHYLSLVLLSNICNHLNAALFFLKDRFFDAKPGASHKHLGGGGVSSAIKLSGDGTRL